MKNKNLEMELEIMKSNEKITKIKRTEVDKEVVDINSEAERIQEVFHRIDEEQRNDDKWRTIQSEYRGKDGTAKLKEWCLEHEVPYKNKDNAMMAVLAAETER